MKNKNFLKLFLLAIVIAFSVFYIAQFIMFPIDKYIEMKAAKENYTTNTKSGTKSSSEKIDLKSFLSIGENKEVIIRKLKSQGYSTDDGFIINKKELSDHLSLSKEKKKNEYQVIYKINLVFSGNNLISSEAEMPLYLCTTC